MAQCSPRAVLFQAFISERHQCAQDARHVAIAPRRECLRFRQNVAL